MQGSGLQLSSKKCVLNSARAGITAPPSVAADDDGHVARHSVYEQVQKSDESVDDHWLAVEDRARTIV